MCVLSDREWAQRYAEGHPIVMPFVPQVVKYENGHPIVSYGVDSTGYSVRLGSEFIIPVPGQTIDTHALSIVEDQRMTVNEKIVLRPRQFVLGHTLEVVKVPEDISLFILDKSSLARVGVSVFNTMAAPGWDGRLTLEIVNNSESFITLYVGEGICQLVAVRGDKPAIVYRGKYNHAQSVQGAR